MGLRCAGQLAGDGWGLQGSSPRGGPLSLGATISSVSGPAWGQSWSGPSPGEEKIQTEARVRGGPGGAGHEGAQAELSVRTLVEFGWVEMSNHYVLGACYALFSCLTGSFPSEECR